MTTGRLIAVVGPSGVGKDSVMEALAAAHGPGRVRRVITRDAEAGGEAFDAVTPAQFDQMAQDGAFALHWRAHGLSYGIPAQVDARLNSGDMLVNLSRGVLREAAARFAGLVVVNLTATPEVLAQRLAGRGRESAEDIAARLSRADKPLPAGIIALEIDNSGALDRTVEAIADVLYPVRAKR